MEQLIHLIYTSAACGDQTRDSLEEILRVSRKNNERLLLSGMLLYSEGTFFQVLEGEPAAVDRAFAAIVRDSRHRGVVTIIRERISSRGFPTWTMGFVTATSREIARAIGMNDFFDEGSSLAELDHGRAKKLLAAFLAGRWRANGDVPVTSAGRGF